MGLSLKFVGIVFDMRCDENIYGIHKLLKGRGIN